MNYNLPAKEFIIQPCFHKQLAAAYGISSRALHNMIRPYRHLIGQRRGYRYTIAQLLIIFEKIGWPSHALINQ